MPLSRAQGRSPAPVLLVSMPWTTLTEPSLGLCLLKAVLQREAIPCQVLHLNLFLLEFLQAHTYNQFSTLFALNDFLFSGTLDPHVTNRQHRWLRYKVRQLIDRQTLDMDRFHGSEGLVEALLHLRHELIPPWLDMWAKEIAQGPAPLVGFSCMFDQTIASLALAKKVRAMAPEKMLVLGGYAVRPPTAQMILRSSPWIDAICTGEGEVTAVGLARAATGACQLGDVPGIAYRSASGDPVRTAAAAPVDLDANPTPDFDDFFADIRRLSTDHSVDITPRNLLIENSRGCWWGTKNHCVFCGIHDEDLRYRARDAKRVLASLAELKEKHGINFFRFSDYILPNQYFETLLPALVEMGSPYRLSAESKANLTEERVALMAEAGCEELQPGIESFSSDALRKMRKGVSALQNVHTLLLGRRFGIRVYFNLLYGFPDDDPREYERMVALLPRLFHLDSPVTCGPVRITRYSPMQAQPQHFGVGTARPDPTYSLIFSEDYLRETGFRLEDYCYYFEREFENSTRLTRLYEQINKVVDTWRSVQGGRQAWLYQDGPPDRNGAVVIRDRRDGEEKIHHLDATASEVLVACSRPTSLATLRGTSFAFAKPEDIGHIADYLGELGLVFPDGDRVLSVVLPVAPAPLKIDQWYIELEARRSHGSAPDERPVGS